MITMFASMEYWTEKDGEVLQAHYDDFVIESTSHPAILRTLQCMVDELAELDNWEAVAGCTESIYEDDGHFPYYEIEPGYHERKGKKKPLW